MFSVYHDVAKQNLLRKTARLKNQHECTSTVSEIPYTHDTKALLATTQYSKKTQSGTTSIIVTNMSSFDLFLEVVYCVVLGVCEKKNPCGYDIPQVNPAAFNCITLPVYQSISAFRQQKIAVSQ